MKIFVTFLALLALGYSAPQPRNLFHEHYEEFIDLIREETQEEFDQLMEEYAQFEEFQAGIEYLMSSRFRNLVYEMEDIPEFKAVVEFLETNNVDILYFINRINEAVEIRRRHNDRSTLRDDRGKTGERISKLAEFSAHNLILPKISMQLGGVGVDS